MLPTPAFVSELEARFGASAVLTGDDVRERKASWLSDAPCAALAIVRPASTDEVQALVKLCAEDGRCIVPVGGNTGLVDGTIARPGDVMLSLERMNTIEEVDAASATMTVQAGVPLQRVQESAEEAGLAFPVDLGARGSATVGGTISTNAGGNGVIRYGMMREQVLGLEAVLADGTVLSSMNRMLKNNAGYDLKQLFIGTEGTLGIVTRAVLRLRAAMPQEAAAMLAVDRFDHIPTLLRRLDAELGGTLNAFEVLWPDFIDCVLGARHVAPVDRDAAAWVLVEARGGVGMLTNDGFEAMLTGCLEDGLIKDAAIAQSHAQRQAFWAIRDDIDALVEQMSPAIAFDVSLPIASAESYVVDVHRRLYKRFGDRYRAATFGHLGDGNIHFILTIGEHDAAERDALMSDVYALLESIGGSVSAEHGIGLEKKQYLGLSRSREEIALMRRLKSALDPQSLLNPGKIFDGA